MNLDFDEKRLNKKKGRYAFGESIYLADPSLHAKAQDFKRELSAKMHAVSTQDIARIQAARGYLATRKYDGEFCLIFFDGKQLISVNPGGTMRRGLPAFEEAEKLLKAAKVKSCILAGEIHLHAENYKGLRINRVVGILRNPESEKEMERLAVAVFGNVEVDGKAPDNLKNAFSLIDKWFGKGKLVYPAQHVPTKTTDDILALLADWVIEGGSEGIVLQHDTAGWYKIKLRHSLDVAVIGYSEGSDERKGLLHDLLVGVRRADGTFQELTRVGGGFTDEDRKNIAAEMKRRVVPSDYVAVNNDYVAYEMIKPGPVIEISCLDLLTESSRGGPVNRMVLKWDGKRYSALSRMPLVSVISPQYIRIRDDKDALEDGDVSIRQLTELAPVTQTEKSADDEAGEPSKLLERVVYTKEMKGNLMVRKLLLWKTNKEKSGEFPAFVVYLTDFSPNRKTPLERDIRIAATEAAARKHFKRMAEENFIGGWEKA